ncbi:class I SAM-dependent methyltransferase [Rhizorhapis suberifaciens]|uniref:Class I SAM-dependent methyltransferase n=1 Tax=Rhizorhapis suberifaciens TaxID=13656 RepID=A0A840HPD5_9SPHN|nr:class I SAM-dependent methyltransferase [Rhizorhapis suberifaciens]MBB4639765.1 hypothetical protein [Rhizorhapis suberifaciens]
MAFGEQTKDRVGALLAKGLAGPLRFFANSPPRASRTGDQLRKNGIAIYERHYYNPFITDQDLLHPLENDRKIPGIKLDAGQQLEFLRSLRGLDELEAFFAPAADERSYCFENQGDYGHGDADILYGMIRTFKPRRLIEIGAGQSTKLAQAAIACNVAEDGDYQCAHICIEPYEQPWLERLDVTVIRERVERCPAELFAGLDENDILFIDSSHVIRPQGDVLFEFLQILPTLKSGVLVHIHDIFTPADYPEEWIFDRKVLWNEQYLLEAFLSMNAGYGILVASNWLAKRYNACLRAILPGMLQKPSARPGSFWIRRV